jgi:hypothetical protein
VNFNNFYQNLNIITRGSGYKNVTFWPVVCFLLVLCFYDSIPQTVLLTVQLSYTRWFKYDRDDLCVNKSQFVLVIFEPPCILTLFLLFLSRREIPAIFYTKDIFKIINFFYKLFNQISATRSAKERLQYFYVLCEPTRYFRPLFFVVADF